MMAIRRNNGWIPPANRSNQHIERWRNLLYPRSSIFAESVQEAIQHKPELKTTVLAIHHLYKIVLFRPAHYMAKGEDYQRGLIVGAYYNGVVQYKIETVNGIQDVGEWRTHAAKELPLLPAPKARGNKALPQTPEIILLPAMAGRAA